MPGETNPKVYAQLLSDICALYDRTLIHSADQNVLTLKTYWQIGNRIRQMAGDVGETGGYGKQVIQNLSADLTQKYGTGFGPRSVAYFRSFATVYDTPEVLNPNLSWSHYRALLSIADDDAREALEQRTVEEGLTKNQLLKLAAQLRLCSENSSREFPLTPRAARPGIYKVVSPPDTAQKKTVLDLGFNVQHAVALAGSRAPVAAGSYIQQQTPRTYTAVDIEPGERYCYFGEILDVIDGDTVRLRCRLGFDIYIVERMRLRGVDAMELTTPEGKKARNALIRFLKGATSVHAFTYHHDKYGRYIADLIVDEHRYINKKLVETGHARFLKM